MSIRKDIENLRNDLSDTLDANRKSTSWIVVMPAGAPVTFEQHADGDEPVRYENPKLLGGRKYTRLTQEEAEMLASHLWDGRGLQARAVRLPDYLGTAIIECERVLELIPKDQDSY